MIARTFYEAQPCRMLQVLCYARRSQPIPFLLLLLLFVSIHIRMLFLLYVCHRLLSCVILVFTCQSGLMGLIIVLLK